MGNGGFGDVMFSRLKGNFVINFSSKSVLVDSLLSFVKLSVGENKGRNRERGDDRRNY